MSRIYDYDCPCKGCKDRMIGCHATCQKYKEWQKNSIEVKKIWIDRKGKRRKDI